MATARWRGTGAGQAGVRARARRGTEFSAARAAARHEHPGIDEAGLVAARHADRLLAAARDLGSARWTAFFEPMRQAGVEVLPFRPLNPVRTLPWKLNNRDHRKIIVVDNLVGFTGGLNIANDYASVEDGGVGWHDMHCRVSGPQEISAAVNGGCRRLFCRYSAAMRCARAYATRASSSTGTIGAKSRCAIHSSRVNLVMWLETAHSER